MPEPRTITETTWAVLRVGAPPTLATHATGTNFFRRELALEEAAHANAEYAARGVRFRVYRVESTHVIRLEGDDGG